MSEQFPNDPKISTHYANYLTATGNLKEAIRAYRRIQSDDIDINLGMYQGLAYCHAELEQYDKASIATAAGLELNPSDTYLKKMMKHIEDMLEN